ncbi:hypothetical protein [Paracoccus nototheniae]|uniref:hypothetical protein n=1 Tax=Paracoccus nototheniae TaxID=2489002 RepID=UPI0039E7C49F
MDFYNDRRPHKALGGRPPVRYRLALGMQNVNLSLLQHHILGLLLLSSHLWSA